MDVFANKAYGYIGNCISNTFLVPVYMAIVRNGHSISDDLYEMFAYTTCTAFWWKWIAEKTSRV